MPDDALMTCYRDLLKLMAKAEEAMDKKDLEWMELLNHQVGERVAELERLCLTDWDGLYRRHGAAKLDRLIRDTLKQVERNRASIARWLAETGAEPGRLKQGEAAVRGYASPLQGRARFVSREV